MPIAFTVRGKASCDGCKSPEQFDANIVLISKPSEVRGGRLPPQVVNVVTDRRDGLIEDDNLWLCRECYKARRKIKRELKERFG